MFKIFFYKVSSILLIFGIRRKAHWALLPWLAIKWIFILILIILLLVDVAVSGVYSQFLVCFSFKLFTLIYFFLWTFFAVFFAKMGFWVRFKSNLGAYSSNLSNYTLLVRTKFNKINYSAMDGAVFISEAQFKPLLYC